MSSNPAAAQASMGGEAGSPQPKGAFNRFIIGQPQAVQPAQLPLPVGDDSEAKDTVAGTEVPTAAAAATPALFRAPRQERLEAIVAAQAAQVATLLETVNKLTEELAKLKSTPAAADQQAAASGPAGQSAPA